MHDLAELVRAAAGDRLVHLATIPARPARHAVTAVPLPEPLAGRVLLATPTPSHASDATR